MLVVLQKIQNISKKWTKVLVKFCYSMSAINNQQQTSTTAANQPQAHLDNLEM